MISFKEFFKSFFSLLASAGWIIFSLFGTILVLGLFLAIIEKKPISDCIYLSFITAFNIGYGDIISVTLPGKIISFILCMIGMIFIGVIVAATIKALEKAS